jgi:hypothetical protein
MENYTTGSVTMRYYSRNTARITTSRTIREGENKSDIEKIRFKGRNPLEVLNVSLLANERIILNTEVTVQDNES